MVPADKSVVPWVPAVNLSLFFKAPMSLVSGGMFSFYKFKIGKGKRVVGFGVGGDGVGCCSKILGSRGFVALF